MGKGDLYLDTERMLDSDHKDIRRNSQPLWLKLKIFAALCCCHICGIASLAYTVTSQRSLAIGDEYGSLRKHRKARSCLIASIILGIIFIALAGALYYFEVKFIMEMSKKFCQEQEVCLTKDGVATYSADPMVDSCKTYVTCSFPTEMFQWYKFMQQKQA